MIANPWLWACISLLLMSYYAFLGWYGAQVATRQLPSPDLRTRPSDEAIADACALLRISFPATDLEIDQARRKLMPRAPGDFFEDGTLRAHKVHDIFAAADLLKEANAYDSNPPYEACYVLDRWNHHAGALGRIWGRLAPPEPLTRIRLQAEAAGATTCKEQ